MATRDELINSINSMSDYLNTISMWYTRPHSEPFGHIETSKQTSYIYEFYCYVRFVKDLSNVGNSIAFVCTGAKGNNFPMGPSEKNEGWAKFVIKDETDNIIYDVCGGVNIHSIKIPHYTYAADISIQIPCVVPYENDLMHIIDAKYIDPIPKPDSKKKDPHKLPIRQLREFRAVISDFKLPKICPTNLILNGTCFQELTIVTNGEIDPNHNNYALNFCFKQIDHFKP
ncbi:MAG: hypothetical protein CVU05_06320 [Bacteroidetes bacterium HGW-Bacteroidetes-21]|jgi:hypothetical protein|nr:MAG: hypothetical protein CVU05_06320 [Bacteroidetes bacterium HGW-Bacteroidetes-21]